MKMAKITTRPGFVDKHRQSMSGIKAVETEKWGQLKAYERTADYRRGSQDVAPPMPKPIAPELGCEPQFRNTDGRARDWADDVPESSYLRGGGKNAAEGKSNFDRRGKDGNPKKW
jgi:hypothetical protein